MSQVICLFIGAIVGFMLGWLVRAKNKNSDTVRKVEDAGVDIDQGYYPGEEYDNLGNQVATGNWIPMGLVKSGRNLTSFSAGATTPWFISNKAGGAIIPTLASWAYRLIVNRGW